MDKREALEMCLKVHDECMKHSDCQECPFHEVFEGHTMCLSHARSDTRVAKWVRKKLNVMGEKQEERAILGGYGDEEKIAMTSALLRWTYKQMGRGRMICPYLPSEEQISEFVLKNKIPRDVAQNYRTVIRAYLNDYNFAQVENAGMSCKLFNRGNKLELIVL